MPLPLPPKESPDLFNVKPHSPGCFQIVHSGRLNLTCVCLADPDRYRPIVRLFPGSRRRYRPIPGFRPRSNTDRASANPSKTASRGSANPQKMASKGSTAPSKSANKGSVGHFKNRDLEG